MAKIIQWDTTVDCGKTVPTGECKGRVRVKGFFDSSLSGETSVGPCSHCGFKDWTDDERAEMTTQAMEDADG